MDFILVIIGFVIAVYLFVFYNEKRTQKRLEPYQDAFARFLEESKSTCQKDRGYPQATLFRHVWRRAVVMEAHFAKTEEEKLILKNIQEIAARNYYACAPQNAYGKVKLQITPNQVFEYLKREQSQPKDTSRWNTKKFACIYIGQTKDGKMYVGKTVNEPERRWLEHRKMGTGPFKYGNDYAEWSVIRGNIALTDLDYWESYYIGYYNTYEKGYNENFGNDKPAYILGRKDARDKVTNSEKDA